MSLNIQYSLSKLNKIIQKIVKKKKSLSNCSFSFLVATLAAICLSLKAVAAPEIMMAAHKSRVNSRGAIFSLSCYFTFSFWFNAPTLVLARYTNDCKRRLFDVKETESGQKEARARLFLCHSNIVLSDVFESNLGPFVCARLNAFVSFRMCVGCA